MGETETRVALDFQSWARPRRGLHLISVTGARARGQKLPKIAINCQQLPYLALFLGGFHWFSLDFQSRRGSALDLGDGGEGEGSERFNLGDGGEDEGSEIAISAPRVSVHRDPLRLKLMSDDGEARRVMSDSVVLSSIY